jgi:hypothetical protein
MQTWWKPAARLSLVCTNNEWHEALSCSFWLDSHVDMFGVGLIYLTNYMMVVEMRTPGPPDWKRVIITCEFPTTAGPVIQESHSGWSPSQ